MSGFSLRPIHDMSPSPSPTASTTSPDDHHHSPAYKVPAPAAHRPSPPGSLSGRPRRPFSPSSLRDLDLSQTSEMQSRKYPAPPTGHDLMAMFPAPPPDNFPEMRPGPTSGYFQRQERDFFKKAGKEILRVRLEVDMPYDSSNPELGKPSASLSRANSSSSRPWPPTAAGPSSSHGLPPASGSASHSPNILSSAAPPPYPHPASRSSPRGSLSNPSPLFPLSTNHPHPHSQPPPPNLHPPPGPAHQNGPGVRTTPPQDPSQLSSTAKSEFSQDDYDDSESWRRPIPFAERRRAGKHTRRVIVRT
ncbi:hypothetical protein DFP72DRAFT_513660 [Ephemerocybe angulata]|uniref:Uncharacterized protein n=1 Tax=Ephemerocybe angulata TaxID=980116 RepID=A0A8H6HQ90_9AGAR|nr:hypothetical protein DFP72DRAFT_513660 [Tulosesus angulatus]